MPLQHAAAGIVNTVAAAGEELEIIISLGSVPAAEGCATQVNRLAASSCSLENSLQKFLLKSILLFLLLLSYPTP